MNLNRTASTTIKNGSTTLYTSSIGYVAGDGTNSTLSYRVATVNNAGETLTCSYDERGYITQVSKDANNYSQYRYDGFGQLVRENYMWGGTSYTKKFFYDEGGNIDYKETYAFVNNPNPVGPALETIDYDYGDSTWKDKLTSFNGATITYDEIGNPLTDGTWTYTWAQGRKLQQITNGTTTVSYLKEELTDIKLAQSLMLLVDALRRVLQDCPMISEQVAHQIMNAFFDAIPDFLKQNLRSCA